MELPPLANLSFELASYAIALVVFLKATREGRFQGFLFIAAVVATCAAELVGLRVAHGYYYSDFLIKIDGRSEGMPLCIALDWAVIVFCIWRLGERLDVRWYLLPFALAALALPLDLALDPAASQAKLVTMEGQPCLSPDLPPGSAQGLGYWVWCVSPENRHELFGVPLENFVGWYMLVVSFTFCALLARRKLAADAGHARTAALMAGVVVGTCVIEFGVLWIIEQLEILGLASTHIFIALMAGGLAVIAASGNRRSQRTLDQWALVALGGDAIFCVLAYFGSLSHTVGAGFAIWLSAMLGFGLALSLWVMLGNPFVQRRTG